MLFYHLNQRKIYGVK